MAVPHTTMSFISFSVLTIHGNNIEAHRNTFDIQENMTMENMAMEPCKFNDVMTAGVDFKARGPEFDLPKPRSKLTLLLCTWVFGLLGIDRCWLAGGLCLTRSVSDACFLGVLKGVTCGGCTIWFFIDLGVIWWNAFQKSSELDILGLHARFEDSSLDSAFLASVGMTCVFIVSYLLGHVLKRQRKNADKEAEEWRKTVWDNDGVRDGIMACGPDGLHKEDCDCPVPQSSLEKKRGKSSDSSLRLVKDWHEGRRQAGQTPAKAKNS